MKPFLVSVSLVTFALASVFAGETPHAEKRGYHLFSPTPPDQMRELSTDRPDTTESAYTVDAGHFQIETDLLSFSYDRHNRERSKVRTENWSWGATNFKVGLLNNLDLQLVVPFYNRGRSDDRATRTAGTQQGFGDLTARVKMNLWGNDGGSTALGLMPFVKLPTAQDDLGNGSVEGGLIIPLSVSLPAGWSMGLMAEFDFLEDDERGSYHTDFVNSITFSHDLVGGLGGYFEFVSIATTEAAGAWNATLDLGLTYGVTKDLQLDAGVNLGLTRGADDLSPFVGVSWRF
jgi:hypothetical protein